MSLLILYLAAGLGLLILGADWLVRGASRLALRLGLSPLLIGLTVVAFGTSAPELAVSVQSAFAGSAGMAVGNVVGSNIFNVLVVLGASALITPLVVQQQLVRVDVPLLCVVSAVFWAMTADGRLSTIDGVFLFVGVVAYTVFAVRNGRTDTPTVEEEYDAKFGNAAPTAALALQLGLIVAGLAALVAGAHWLVEGATGIARAFNVSETVIGLTIVAGGTSLPEVATSVVAAVRGERDIAVGNVVGSSLFNLLAIAGLAAIIAPGGLEVPAAIVRFDIPVMLAVAVACLPIFAAGHLIARWHGALFLGYYLAYLAFLLMDATGHDALPAYSSMMSVFVLPLTAVTLVVLWWRAPLVRRAS